MQRKRFKFNSQRKIPIKIDVLSKDKTNRQYSIFKSWVFIFYFNKEREKPYLNYFQFLDYF